jgi:ATP-dependent helicase/nuclease subunit B
MRERLGLPPPERRIGLSAHDFSQAACAPKVVLVHTERRGGQPSVKSRWLWRLETLARGADLVLPGRAEILEWARGLDDAGAPQSAPRPAPTPPVADRPIELAVTRVETLTRDPYAVWARDILRLYPLDRPNEAIDARARGTAIHSAFETFSRQWPEALPPNAAQAFEALYIDALIEAGMPRSALARERPLAREAALWVAEMEQRRRAAGPRIEVERKGRLTVEIGGEPFTLTAKTDRIEVTREGVGHILDYKTGKAPSKKMVETGFSPQLTLTAAILAHGRFEDLPKLTPGELTYVEVTGRRPAGKEEVRSEAYETPEKADLALDGLKRLIARYRDANMPYVSRTAPQFVKTYAGDYDHLARVFEWSTSGDDEGGE